MKTFFLLVLLSLAAGTTFAQANDVQPRDDYEKYKVEPINKLQDCQEYITQRCHMGKEPFRWYKSCQEVQHMHLLPAGGPDIAATPLEGHM
jgi:hypothetical protein